VSEAFSVVDEVALLRKNRRRRLTGLGIRKGWLFRISVKKVAKQTDLDLHSFVMLLPSLVAESRKLATRGSVQQANDFPKVFPVAVQEYHV
jgi:hypothetical protein